MKAKLQNLSKINFNLMALIFLTLATFKFASAGDQPNEVQPSSDEISADFPSSFDTEKASALEDKIKQALESGNSSDAVKFKRELDKILPLQSEIATVPSSDVVFDNARAGEEQTDWAPGSTPVSTGSVNGEIAQYHRQLDMKMGEDGNIYVAVNRSPAGLAYKARIEAYRSSNGGKTWTFCGAINLMNHYVFSISMTVESKDNFVPDSTRLNIFYTTSTSASNTNAKLNIGTFRRNGTAGYFAHVSDPTPAYSFHSLSAVSDGAFWGSLTYFGLVACESDLTENANTKFKIFKTTNWGSTFQSTTIETNNRDYYPSAQFFNSSSDEIWFAVERRVSANEKQIRVIKTTWSLSSSFTTSNVTSGISYKYEKPCLSIKQNNPSDSAVISCTRNNLALYHFTTNGGSGWVTNHALTSSATADKVFTWCSSVPDGSKPFTFLLATSGGNEISVRQGAAGALELGIQYMINSNQFSNKINPVCVSRETPEGNIAAVAYAGTGETNTYFDSEGHKFLSVKLALQGLYNPTINAMNVNDVASIVLKTTSHPYRTIDSVSCTIHPGTMLTSSTYPSVTPVRLTELQSNGSYYLVVRHRNSLETWSSVYVHSYNDTINYDFTQTKSKAHGSNQIQVDNNPQTFGIYSGDVNQDGTIDASDLSSIDNDITNFMSGYRVTDINGDQFIDASDASITDNNATNFVSLIRP